MIKSLFSDLCVGTTEHDSDNWASVKHWRCDGLPWHLWRKVQNDDGWFQLRSAHTGKCLDVAFGSVENNADIILYECHDGANMLWRETTPVKLKSTSTEKCMEVGGWAKYDGANINQWDCMNWSRHVNQVWGLESFDQPGPCLFRDPCRLRSLNSGYCATASSSGRGIALRQNKCEGEFSWWDKGAQKWYFDERSNSSSLVEDVPTVFEIVNSGSQSVPYGENCIDVRGGAKENGISIDVYPCTGVPWQGWRIDMPVR